MCIEQLGVLTMVKDNAEVRSTRSNLLGDASNGTRNLAYVTKLAKQAYFMSLRATRKYSMNTMNPTLFQEKIVF